MSKSKEKLQKMDDEIAKKKQEEIAKAQLEAAREIAVKGFSSFGIRDIFENKAVQALIISLGVFFGVFIGTSILFFYTRDFQWALGFTSLFVGELIPGLPNYIFWIIGIAAAIIIILFRRKRKKE